MRRSMRVMALVALASAWCATAVLADQGGDAALASAEAAFLDYLDAVGARGVVDSGFAPPFEGRDAAGWAALARERRATLDGRLAVAAGAGSCSRASPPTIPASHGGWLADGGEGSGETQS